MTRETILVMTSGLRCQPAGAEGEVDADVAPPPVATPDVVAAPLPSLVAVFDAAFVPVVEVPAAVAGGFAADVAPEPAPGLLAEPPPAPPTFGDAASVALPPAPLPAAGVFAEFPGEDVFFPPVEGLEVFACPGGLVVLPAAGVPLALPEGEVSFPPAAAPLDPADGLVLAPAAGVPVALTGGLAAAAAASAPGHAITNTATAAVVRTTRARYPGFTGPALLRLNQRRRTYEIFIGDSRPSHESATGPAD